MDEELIVNDLFENEEIVLFEAIEANEFYNKSVRYINVGVKDTDGDIVKIITIKATVLDEQLTSLSDDIPYYYEY